MPDHQVLWLFILAMPVACISWTVTHEEVFREPRDFCKRCSEQGSTAFTRKFFYLFTCEYCFSHYAAIFIVAISGYQLLLPGWRGYLIGGFSVVWVANVYMSVFALLRTDLKKERLTASIKEKELQKD